MHICQNTKKYPYFAVNCQVGYVPARDGGQVLAITNMSPIKATSAGKVDLGDEFASLLEEKEEASTEENLD